MADPGNPPTVPETNDAPSEISDVSTVLEAAAKAGNTSEVLSLLQKHSETNIEPTPESLRALALRHAAESGHADLVATLLKLDIDAETREAVLLSAATNGHEAVTRVLLRYQRKLPIWPYLYKKGPWMTGFLDAAASGHLSTVRAMIDEGISANLKYQCAECAWGCIEDRLLRTRGRCGICLYETPICLAAQHGRGDVVELLLARGARASAELKRKMTALHFAAERADEQMVRQLLRAGWDPNRADPGRKTPILMAALSGDKAVFDLLLHNGGKVGRNEAWCLVDLINARSSAGLGMVLEHIPPEMFVRFTCEHREAFRHLEEPLGKAVATNDVAVARCILDYNRKHDVLPPFEYVQGFRAASRSRNEAMMGLLVEYCPWSDQRTRDKHIFDAIEQTAARGHSNAVLMLLEWHYEFGRCPALLEAALVAAVHFNRTATVKVLLDTAGADVNTQISGNSHIHGPGKTAYSRRGDTPINIAARNGAVEMCRILLEHGAFVWWPGYEARTPLHLAAERASSVGLLELLLENGADLKATTLSEETAVRVAKGVDNLACLHKAGANLNHQDWDGKTALHWAADEEDVKKCEWLLELGADDSLCDRNGKSGRECHQEMLKKIEKRNSCICWRIWKQRSCRCGT
ncbi:ankyrin repeat-containing domain protein [Aspergillus carlsbadensis]|nr:ankyrin repeat-containing domain protein [Aspergillus carlsbadensis]